MDLNDSARALLRDCEALARRTSGNDYAEIHVARAPEGFVTAVAIDLGRFSTSPAVQQASANARGAFAEGFGKRPEAALEQLRRALREVAGYEDARPRSIVVPPPDTTLASQAWDDDGWSDDSAMLVLGEELRRDSLTPHRKG